MTQASSSRRDTPRAPSALDIDWVRGQFAALAGEWVFFDNAGGSLIANPVVDRVARYLRETPVQLGATYSVSTRAGERVDKAVRRVSRWLGVDDPDRLVIGPSTTVLIANLARALEPTLAQDAEIIVTDVDHEANATPWRRLAQRGAQVKTWRLNRESLSLELDDLDALLTDRTRLVAVTHASNVLGEIMPLEKIARRVHDAGAELCVDAVAFMPHRLPDLAALEVDYYTFSFYKTFGPHLAVMVGRSDRLAALANINHDFFGRDDVPYKLQPGGPNYELTYGCSGIVDYLEALGVHHGATGDSRALIEASYRHMTEHEHALTARLLDYLAGKRGVKIMGPTTADPAVRNATVSFAVDGRDSAAITLAMDAKKIGIRHGHFYAPRLIDRLGLAEKNGVVRVSMVHYNTLDEVDAVCRAFDEIL